jgi:hypothetical protein
MVFMATSRAAWTLLRTTLSTLPDEALSLSQQLVRKADDGQLVYVLGGRTASNLGCHPGGHLRTS